MEFSAGLLDSSEGERLRYIWAITRQVRDLGFYRTKTDKEGEEWETHLCNLPNVKPLTR